jgi:ABC-type Fe3+ transport system substrate-binding protein
MRKMISRKRPNGWRAGAFVFLLLALFAFQPFNGLCASSQVIEAAKKEGELGWWTTIAQDQSQKIIDEFMKLYPFIKVSYWRSGSVGIHNKVLIEARAGRSTWDVLSQTTPEFINELKQRALIAPYDSPERRAFSNDFKDGDAYWTGTYALPTGLGFNTRQVKREDVPKNYQDLLHPKWKGKKISIDDESYEFLAGLMQAWGREAALEYFKKLAAQEPVIGRGNSQRTQLLAAGEFPLAIAYTHTVEYSKSQGNSVDWVNLEPVAIKFDGIMLGAKAAHANAAKLFIDFILSQQGQALLQSFKRITLREGVEPDPPRLIKGFKRIVLHPEKAQDAGAMLKLYRGIFGLP